MDHSQTVHWLISLSTTATDLTLGNAHWENWVSEQEILIPSPLTSPTHTSGLFILPFLPSSHRITGWWKILNRTSLLTFKFININQNFLVPDTVPHTLQTYLVFTLIPSAKNCYGHITGEETVPHMEEVICAKILHWQVAEPQITSIAWLQPSHPWPPSYLDSQQQCFLSLWRLCPSFRDFLK
jgi:hypothetical protein